MVWRLYGEASALHFFQLLIVAFAPPRAAPFGELLLEVSPGFRRKQCKNSPVLVNNLRVQLARIAAIRPRLCRVTPVIPHRLAFPLPGEACLIAPVSPPMRS